jgi:hypothetical protein
MGYPYTNISCKPCDVVDTDLLKPNSYPIAFAIILNFSPSPKRDEGLSVAEMQAMAQE